MTAEEIGKSIGVCGLVCALCSYSANCAGCRCKDEDCSIKKCCAGKELDYCFLCDEFPCGERMFKNIRLRAFNMVAREDGIQKLSEYLAGNYVNGIRYHRNDGVQGDYDSLKSEGDVISLLKNGRHDIYDVCPTYETRSFLMRLVSPEDAEELCKCYGSEEARRFFNNDNCSFGYDKVDAVEKMQYNIGLWLDAFRSRSFIRLSIISKATGNVVGTTEMFGGDPGVLRIDILPEYEHENYMVEFLNEADSFFYDFDCRMIVTKAVPEAAERIKALTECGYKPYLESDKWNREHYFMKTRSAEKTL